MYSKPFFCKKASIRSLRYSCTLGRRRSRKRRFLPVMTCPSRFTSLLSSKKQSLSRPATSNSNQMPGCFPAALMASETAEMPSGKSARLSRQSPMALHQPLSSGLYQPQSMTKVSMGKGSMAFKMARMFSAEGQPHVVQYSLKRTGISSSEAGPSSLLSCSATNALQQESTLPFTVRKALCVVKPSPGAIRLRQWPNS